MAVIQLAQWITFWSANRSGVVLLFKTKKVWPNIVSTKNVNRNNKVIAYHILKKMHVHVQKSAIGIYLSIKFFVVEHYENLAGAAV